MSTLNLTLPTAAGSHRIRIDVSFLVRQVAGLARVKMRRRTWNEFGEKVLKEYLSSSNLARIGWNPRNREVTPESTYWKMTRTLVHEVVATADPKHDMIRKRLGNLRDPSTRVLLSTLSLWLAGALGITTSVTGPLVAAMLFGVADAGGDWEVLVRNE